MRDLRVIETRLLPPKAWRCLPNLPLAHMHVGEFRF